MDDEGRRQFGGYLRGLREAARWTQWEVAAQAGIRSVRFYGQVERGERGLPSARVLRRLDSLYGLPSGTIHAYARSLDPFGVWLDSVAAVSHEALEAAFRAAISDPEWSHGGFGRRGGGPLTPAQRLFVVYLHGRSTGRWPAGWG